MTAFVVFALPRSRTYWLSRFLQYGPWCCGHDEIAHVRALDDVRSWLAQPYTGTAETGAAPFWRLVSQYAPAARIVTVRRDQRHVLQSLKATGLDFDERVMAAVLAMHDRKLDQIERRLPGVMSVRYEDLAREETCAALFEHCLGLPHDHDWWAAMSALNLQRNIHQVLRYYTAHAAQVDKARMMARHEMMRGLRRPVAMDGISFQQEPLTQLLCDGAHLLDGECAAFGEYPETWRNLNVPLLERLEASGSLHIYTARTGNGRMAAYAAYAIGECLYAADQLEAEHVVFFAESEWPGLGRKLQSVAVEDLRARGVDRVLLFQPDETRVGLVYRRLGAKQTGQRFVLELQ